MISTVGGPNFTKKTSNLSFFTCKKMVKGAHLGTFVVFGAVICGLVLQFQGPFKLKKYESKIESIDQIEISF